MNKKGNLAIRKLVVIIIILLVIFIILLAFFPAFRSKILSYIKGLPEYEYKYDKLIDMSDLEKEHFKMICEYKVARIGEEVETNKIISLFKKGIGVYQRKLYFYDNGKWEETDFYWQGDSLQELKVMFDGKEISKEIGSDKTIEIKQEIENNVDKSYLLWLDGAEMIGGSFVFCRDKEPEISQKALEDLDEIIKLINEAGKSSKKIGEYKVKSSNLILFNWIGYGKNKLPNDKEVCICPQAYSWEDREKVCEVKGKCEEADYTVVFENEIKLDKNKIYFENIGNKVRIRDYEASGLAVIGEVDISRENNIKLYVNEVKTLGKSTKLTGLEIVQDKIVSYGLFGRISKEVVGTLKEDKIYITNWDFDKLTREELELLDGSVLIDNKIYQQEDVGSYFVYNQIPVLKEDKLFKKGNIGYPKVVDTEEISQFYLMEGSDNSKGVLISLKGEKEYPYRVEKREIDKSYDHEGKVVDGIPAYTIYLYYDEEWHPLTSESWEDTYGYLAIKRAVGEKPEENEQ